MKNWKTTSTGIIGMVMAVLGIILKLLNGETIGSDDIALIGGVLSSGLGLFYAKDAQTPTTTVSQKMEPVGPATIEKTL